MADPAAPEETQQAAEPVAVLAEPAAVVAEPAAVVAEPAAVAAEPAAAGPETPAAEVSAPAAEPEVAPAPSDVPATASETELPVAESDAMTTVVVVVSAPPPKDSTGMQKPKYDPMLSHNVRKPLSYSRTVIADQELLLANLTRMKQELARDDRELSILAKTLFNHDSKKWTPPNSHQNEANLRGGYALIKICKMF